MSKYLIIFLFSILTATFLNGSLLQEKVQNIIGERDYKIHNSLIHLLFNLLKANTRRAIQVVADAVWVINSGFRSSMVAGWRRKWRVAQHGRVHSCDVSHRVSWARYEFQQTVHKWFASVTNFVESRWFFIFPSSICQISIPISTLLCKDLTYQHS